MSLRLTGRLLTDYRPPVGVEFGILGPVRVVHDGTLPSLAGTRERAVLALLLLSPNQIVSSDRLIDGLWNDRPPDGATKALQVYVSRLRKALGQASLDGRLLTRSPGYLLRVGSGELDAARFDTIVARAREEAAGGDHHRAAATLRTALALWRGPALADIADAPFARNEAARLEEARLAALEERIDADLACGHHAEVMAELEALTRAHPLRERLWAGLMTALYRAGRQAEALRTYQRLRRILGDDLGIEPSPGIARLETAILRQDPTLDWLPSPAPAPARPSADFQGQLRQMPFTGRGAEFARLQSRLADAATGRGGLVMVMGEAGIGKTRLAEELSGDARRQGWSVLWGRCFEGPWTPPYAPFAEAIDMLVATADADELRADLGAGGPALAQLVTALRRRIPDLPDPVPVEPDEERFRLLDTAVQLLVAGSARKPILLCLDDLHWSDGGTVALLTHLARFAPQHRLLVLGTYRDAELARTHPLAEVLPTLGRQPDFDRIHLQGLPAEVVEELLRAMAAQELPKLVTVTVAAETDGNPFFIREVLRHLLEEGTVYRDPDGCWTSDPSLGEPGIPDSVREVVHRRLSRLSDDAKRLLAAACAFDQPFRFDVVAEVCALAEDAALDALEEAITAQLLEDRPAGEFCAFTHALIRHALYADASSPRRARLHRRVAEVLAARLGAVHPTPAAAGEIAHHYQRSAELPGAERGGSFALEAAAHAEATGAHEEAARFLRAALELLVGDDGRRPDLLGRLGVALTWGLAFDQAVEVAGEAAVAIARAQGPASAAEYLAETAYACTMAGSSPHAWALAGLGLSHTGDRRDVAWARLVSFDCERQAAERTDHPGIGIDTPERRESARILRAARLDPFAPAPMEAVFSSREEAEQSGNLVLRANYLGEFSAAVPAVQADVDAALAQNRIGRALRGVGRLGCAYAALGRLTEAQQSLELARVLSARLGRPYFAAEVQDGLCGALDEGWEEAKEVFWPLAESAPPNAVWALGYIRAASARIAAHLGDRESALRFLELLAPYLENAPIWTMYFPAITGHPAEALWLLDCVDHVEVVEAAVREKVLTPGFLGVFADARLSLARLCALTGRYDEAVAWFAEARPVIAGTGALPLLALADFDEALMYARRCRRGDAEQARPLLKEARRQFNEIGMTGWLRRADALDAQLGR